MNDGPIRNTELSGLNKYTAYVYRYLLANYRQAYDCSPLHYVQAILINTLRFILY